MSWIQFCLRILGFGKLGAMQSTIQSISYDNPEEKRILNACLSSWFKNPKDLNLTDPNMKYPFRFEAWVKQSYSKPGITSFVAKDEEWIIGYISIFIVPNTMAGHLFHLFADPEFRKKGVGSSLIKHAESFAESNGVARLSLNVAPKNLGAVRLYASLGYKPAGTASSGSLIYNKQL